MPFDLVLRCFDYEEAQVNGTRRGSSETLTQENTQCGTDYKPATAYRGNINSNGWAQNEVLSQFDITAKIVCHTREPLSKPAQSQLSLFFR